MDYGTVRRWALTLPREQKQQLARDLQEDLRAGVPGLTLAPAGPRPQSADWVRREQGHAVVDLGPGRVGPDLAEGPAAVYGMWSDAPV